MKIKSILLTLCLCAFAFAGPHSDGCVKNLVDQLKQAEYDKAFDAILDNSPFIMGTSNVANIKMQYTAAFRNIEAQYGKPIGFQILGSKTLGTMERTGYLIQCEKSAWMLEVYEYNNPESKKQYIVGFKVIGDDEAFNRYGV